MIIVLRKGAEYLVDEELDREKHYPVLYSLIDGVCNKEHNLFYDPDGHDSHLKVVRDEAQIAKFVLNI